MVAVAVTDQDGKGSFAGNFPHGHYTLKELSAPEGWKVNTAAFHIDIDRKYLNDDGICEFTFEGTITNEIVHGTPKIAKVDIAGSERIPVKTVMFPPSPYFPGNTLTRKSWLRKATNCA